MEGGEGAGASGGAIGGASGADRWVLLCGGGTGRRRNEREGGDNGHGEGGGDDGGSGIRAGDTAAADARGVGTNATHPIVQQSASPAKYATIAADVAKHLLLVCRRDGEASISARRLNGLA